MQISDMVYASDASETLVRALMAAAEGRTFDRTVEIGPAENSWVIEVACLVSELVAQKTRHRVGVVHLPMRSGETPGARVTADVKTLELVGIDPDPLVPLAEGLARTTEWFREHEGTVWRRM